MSTSKNSKTKSGIIYMLTSPENKRYIGYTTQTLQERIKQHSTQTCCRLINKAIKQFGIDNLKVEILLEINEQFLFQYEKIFINAYDTIEPKGYNIRSGGSGGSRHSEQSKQLMREKKLGPNNHNYGKPRTPEARKNISDAKKCENHQFFGKKFTEEHKLKCAQSHRKNTDDKDLPMYLVKLRESNSGRQNRTPGYAVCNHPTLKNKYFQRKDMTDEEKLSLALSYLSTSEVHRPNGNGSPSEA